jgi:hypothetical protein
MLRNEEEEKDGEKRLMGWKKRSEYVRPRSCNGIVANGESAYRSQLARNWKVVDRTTGSPSGSLLLPLSTCHNAPSVLRVRLNQYIVLAAQWQYLFSLDEIRSLHAAVINIPKPNHAMRAGTAEALPS